MTFNLKQLLEDYYTGKTKTPVKFGTSGHRGSSLNGSFNTKHVAAIVQAAVEYRQRQKYKGPLFLGFDTHALSEAANQTALEVLAANNVLTYIHQDNQYTPTPVISYLIIEHNRQHPQHLADGLIITPSHNPPTDGGIKYNPPSGGPANLEVTTWIENKANEILKNNKFNIIPYKEARKKDCIVKKDFINPYILALNEVVDMKLIKKSQLRLATDPLGGSGLRYWKPIINYWEINLTVTNNQLDPTFSFIHPDYDGQIRMDCSSPYTVQKLIEESKNYDLGFANDPDFDRHGIVCQGQLLNPNHYLAVAIEYLLNNRPHWPQNALVGKTAVSSSILEAVIKANGYQVYETPVGFKWFVDGLNKKEMVFAGEESAGASFLKKHGDTWVSDKDGFIMGLLAAEIMAKTGKNPLELYDEISQKHGEANFQRLDLGITKEQRKNLLKFKAEKLIGSQLEGQKIISSYNKALGNHESLDGFKIVFNDNSWLAIRPSGTEAKLKIYAESFSGPEFLKTLLEYGSKLF